MKTLLTALILFCVSFVHADQASDAFAAAFARSMEAQITRNQTQSQQEELPRHYDMRDNYGNLAGYSFVSYQQCNRMLRFSKIYVECVWIQ